MKVGDLVRTPKVHPRDAEYAMKCGMGLRFYDWEGQFAIVVGFDDECVCDGKPFVEVRIQNTGKLCVFSPSTLTWFGGN